MISLVKALKENISGTDYLAYNINDTKVAVGLPPVPMVGIEYVSASMLNNQVTRMSTLNNKGVFVSNGNMAGVVEIGLLSESASVGAIQAYSLVGLPIPIYSTDIKTAGTSFIFADACRVVKTPQWKRAAAPGITIFSFETNRLIISHGLRLSEQD